MTDPRPAARPRRRWRHAAEYAALRLVVGVCRAAPARLADRVGATLGRIVARAGRPRWDVAMRQLETSFPAADPEWLARVARRCYRHLGAEAVATFRLAGSRRRRLLSRTTVVGLEVLEAARAEGRGVVLVSGHLGNWEVGAAALVARGHPMDIVAARQRNRLFDDYLGRSRARMGMTAIPREDARRGVLAALKAGRIVGIMGDQDARDAGVFVDFFGVPASTARGPAVLALRAEAAMATFYTVRLPGRRPRYRVLVEALTVGAESPPPGSSARNGLPSGMDRRTAVEALTQAHARRLEEHVRRSPEQYFWLHRRWKTPPPAETR